MYNDEKYDYVIRRFNPDYCDVIIFDAFVKLRIPVFEIIEAPDTLPPWRQKQ